MIFKVSLLVISQSLTLVNSSFSHIVNFVSSANKKKLNLVDPLVISLIYNKKVKARAHTLEEHHRKCTPFHCQYSHSLLSLEFCLRGKIQTCC